MKKRTLLGIILVLTMIFSCGCTSSPKEFVKTNLKITLTEDFKDSSMNGYEAYLVSDNVVFSAFTESATNLEYAGYEITSLEGYCMEILNLNNTPKDKLQKRNSYYYFTDTKTVSGANYTYVHCMFEGSNCYWVCEFVCKTKNYKKLKNDILKWADSIEIIK